MVYCNFTQKRILLRNYNMRHTFFTRIICDESHDFFYIVFETVIYLTYYLVAFQRLMQDNIGSLHVIVLYASHFRHNTYPDQRFIIPRYRLRHPAISARLGIARSLPLPFDSTFNPSRSSASTSSDTACDT